MEKENDFDALLSELSSLESTEELTKAMSGEEGDPDMDYEEEDDDKKIKAASENDEDTGDEEYEDEMMGKSLTVNIDGKDVEAFDGAELIKSFKTRIKQSETKLEKALRSTITAIQSRDKIIEKQGSMLKSLQDQMKVIGDTGKGRKAVVSVHEKQSSTELKKSEGVPVSEFRQMLKSAVANGAVNAMDAGRAETALNNGVPVSEAIIAKVAANNK